PDGRPLATHRLTAAYQPAEPGTGTGSPAKPGMAFSIEAEALDLPPAPGLVLGRKVASVQAKGEVKGQIPKGPLPAALDHWREQGGTVEVERLGVHWEPLHLTAGGSLALDQELQPIAAFSASVQGFFETVDAFQNAGLVRARDASMAKVVLGMMAKTPPGGGAPMLTVPLTVQNGILSAGPAVLGPVPRLAWPG
ncbi:MAG: DUF2125 domain-containing protein, partial [Rhodospirillales bacterium]|nr:DUF2125 domain-containing protein [Rhodospirillales bacterium]